MGRNNGNNTSLFKRLWNFVTGKSRRGGAEEQHPRESLAEALETLDNKVTEAERAFADFLMNLRQSEADHHELKEEKSNWSHQVQSISAMYREAETKNEDERRMSQLQEGLRHALTQEIRTEKRIEKQKGLLERQQQVKSGLAKNLKKFKEHRDNLSHKMSELSARETLAMTEKDLYSSSYTDGYSRELEDFENQVRENEYLAIGFKELNAPQYPELSLDDTDDDLELESRLVKEIRS